MSEKLKARDLLIAFGHIQAHGELRDNVYYLNVLRGESGHDGYTVAISDELVTATVGFHNSIDFDAPSHKALEQFIERVESLNASYRN